MSNEVIWYDSSETGAPVLNNVAGAMLAVLDACLINGFNVKSVTSIVVASDVATVTCTGHGYSNSYGKLVKIAGATPAGLNGNKQITVTGANSFTFVTSGISDQTATGTIDARRAPLGTWEKAYTGTNKAMYRSTDAAASGALLRVDDVLSVTGTARAARVRMVETASGVDTFTGPCPTDAQISGGGYWNRGDNTVTAKTWRLIGDGRFFWFLTQHYTSSDHAVNYFGDFPSYKAGDISAAVLAYSPIDPTASYSYTYGVESQAHTVTSLSTNYPVLLRANNGLTWSVTCGAVPGANGVPTNTFGRVNSTITYPSPVDGGLVIAYPAQIIEPGQGFRGVLPGIGYPLANVSAVPDLTILTALQNTSRNFMLAYVHCSNASAIVAFDMTGPWR